MIAKIKNKMRTTLLFQQFFFGFQNLAVLCKSQEARKKDSETGTVGLNVCSQQFKYSFV